MKISFTKLTVPLLLGAFTIAGCATRPQTPEEMDKARFDSALKKLPRQCDKLRYSFYNTDLEITRLKRQKKSLLIGQSHPEIIAGISKKWDHKIAKIRTDGAEAKQQIAENRSEIIAVSKLDITIDASPNIINSAIKDAVQRCTLLKLNHHP